MGFHIGITAALGHSEGQQRFMLGQAMNLNTLVWTIGLCLALQRHRGDQLLSLGAKHSSQGAHWSISMEERIGP